MLYVIVYYALSVVSFARNGTEKTRERGKVVNTPLFSIQANKGFMNTLAGFLQESTHLGGFSLSITFCVFLLFRPRSRRYISHKVLWQKMFALYLRLPNNLSCSILNDWLDLRSIIRLDAANCSSFQRKAWLDLLSSAEFICKKELSAISEKSLAWMVQRHVKVSHFLLFRLDVSFNILRQYLIDNEFVIRSLDINSCPAAYHRVLSQSHLFHHLKSVEYIMRYPEDNDRLLTLLNNNKECLTELKIDCPPSHRLEDIFASVSLPHLSTLSCKVHQQLLPLFSESLLRLDVDMDSFYKMSDHVVRAAAMRCPQLRTLRCQSAFLPAFLEDCPRIVNLCVTNCDCLTDATVLEIVQKLRCLRVLDISDCTTRCTTAALEHIASHCGNTLEELHIYLPGQAFPLVEALRSQLKKLHTFVWVSCYRTLFCSVVVKNGHVTVEAPALADMSYLESLSRLERIDVLVLAFPIYQSLYSVNLVEKCAGMLPEIGALLFRYPQLKKICINEHYVDSAREIYKSYPQVHVCCRSIEPKLDWMALSV